MKTELNRYPIRVAVSGSFSTGKSTFCALLAEELLRTHRMHQVSVIGNISRDLIRSGRVHYDRESSLEDYFIYITEYIHRLRSIKADIIIHDRTLMDTLAYVSANENVPPQFIEMLREIVAWYLDGIKFYFYLPIEFPIISDGIRNNDNNYHIAIDSEIRKNFREFYPQFIELRGSPSERLYKALNALKIDNGMAK